MAKKKDGLVDWVDAPPEIVSAFEIGIRFGLAHSGDSLDTGTADPRWTMDEWRGALKHAVEAGEICKRANREHIEGEAAKAGK